MMTTTLPETVTSALGQKILRPESIAIIGASDDVRKTTARPLKFLLESGFGGRIYPINPRRELVLGLKAWKRVADLPEVPDHVFVVTDAPLVANAVAECGQAGVPVVTVLSGGFSEAGAEGRAREQKLLEIATQYGIRLIGPNSIGVVNPGTGLKLTANAAFAEETTLTGDTLVVSQSGSVIGALMTRGMERGIGFSGFVSTGSESDLSAGEVCAAMVDEPSVGSFALFLESTENANDLAAFAWSAKAVGKPVTVYKLGRSESGSELSVSHTGAVAGSDDEADAFFRACGFVRIETFEGLIETPMLTQSFTPATALEESRVAVISSTGGGAALVVDQLAVRGVNVERPSSEVFRQLAANGIDAHEGLIVDLTLAGTQHDKVKAAVSVLQESGEFDLVVFVLGSSARANPELAVRALTECTSGSTPLTSFVLPEAPESLAMLALAGISAFRTPESCADAIAASYRGAHFTLPREFRSLPEDIETTVLDEAESGEIVRAVGIPMVAGELHSASDDPPRSAIHYPAVIKAVSHRLPHKTEAGAVIVGIDTDIDLEAAKTQITENVEQFDSEIRVDRFLVQQMVTGSVAEALIGYRLTDVGPVVVVAAGGTGVELYKDSALRLAPVDRRAADEMISEVTGLRLAQGFRGAIPGDIASLADAIVSMSNLAANQQVIEAEVNPVAILPEGEGVCGLDALVTAVAHTEEGSGDGS